MTHLVNIDFSHYQSVNIRFGDVISYVKCIVAFRTSHDRDVDDLAFITEPWTEPGGSNRRKLIRMAKQSPMDITQLHVRWTSIKPCAKMVLGIFLMTAMVPTMIGVNEASKGTRDHEDHRRESARKQRSYLSVQCMSYDGSRQQRLAIHNAQVYLGADRKVCFL